MKPNCPPPRDSKTLFRVTTDLRHIMVLCVQVILIFVVWGKRRARAVRGEERRERES